MECREGEFWDGECKECAKDCLKCSGIGKCENCGNLTVSDGKGGCTKCPKGRYIEEGKCKSCGDNC